MPLPPTGLQQQAQQGTMQMGMTGQQPGAPPGQRNAGIKQVGAGQPQGLPQAPASQMTGAPQSPGLPMGQTSLSSLAKTLAQSYGLPLGRQELVDEQGNITATPDQIVAQSGGKETLGSAAAKLNYISSAIAQQQNQRQAQKAESALQAGLGQVRSRGRGSAAAMQSGMYQQLSQLYDNQEYEAADFSYFIMKEQMDFQRDMMRRAEKLKKKGALGGLIGGVIGGALGSVVPGIGTAIGAGLGSQLGGAAGGAGFL